eukprot:GHVS01032478.1.p2 GENE.GHVS01032478.1~~GHVS01032478.1.p2  ORF type:complete len:164 (+),score=6.00 GHVS01032478.1:166-657(+)
MAASKTRTNRIGTFRVCPCLCPRGFDDDLGALFNQVRKGSTTSVLVLVFFLFSVRLRHSERKQRLQPWQTGLHPEDLEEGRRSYGGVRCRVVGERGFGQERRKRGAQSSLDLDGPRLFQDPEGRFVGAVAPEVTWSSLPDLDAKVGTSPCPEFGGEDLDPDPR